MDLKALMQKLETINKTEILIESEKKETTWTDKSGKKHPATQVKGDKYTGKEADTGEPGRKSDEDGPKSKYKKYPVPDKEIDESFTFKGAIAQSLVEEFGYDLDERVTPDGKGGYTGGLTQQPANAAPAANAPANPWTNDPEKAKAWGALSPEDQKWLRGADPTDQFILARAPNKGKPAAPAGLTRSMGAGAATKPTDTTGAPGAQDDVTGVDAAVAAQQGAAGPTDAEIAANNAALGNFDADVAGGSAGEEAPELAMGAGQPAAGGINPTTLNRYKELLDKLEATGNAPAPAPKESVDRLADDQILAIIRNI